MISGQGMSRSHGLFTGCTACLVGFLQNSEAPVCSSGLQDGLEGPRRNHSDRIPSWASRAYFRIAAGCPHFRQRPGSFCEPHSVTRLCHITHTASVGTSHVHTRMLQPPSNHKKTDTVMKWRTTAHFSVLKCLPRHMSETWVVQASQHITC